MEFNKSKRWILHLGRSGCSAQQGGLRGAAGGLRLLTGELPELKALGPSDAGFGHCCAEPAMDSTILTDRFQLGFFFISMTRGPRVEFPQERRGARSPLPTRPCAMRQRACAASRPPPLFTSGTRRGVSCFCGDRSRDGERSSAAPRGVR